MGWYDEMVWCMKALVKIPVCVWTVSVECLVLLGVCGVLGVCWRSMEEYSGMCDLGC